MEVHAGNSSYEKQSAIRLRINSAKLDVRGTDTRRLVSEAIRNAIGAVYIRWGKKTCPSTAELVYEGVIGGSLRSSGGSGANYQCLPLNPIYDTYVPGNQSRARMYGAKYQTNHFSPLAHVDETNPVCSVCRVKSRSTVLMVPGRNQCPADEWTLEYYGYLMSSHHSHKRTEYVCVDRHPESRPSSGRNRGGALLYAVESRCDKGTLPCGPYLDGRELTCAVCTM
ncbi:uncharacterized protein [Ptychodera flava]|uniref:uncharacterized protein n=1 Tax=Ptychodera flava TaxID=63121 RepID=UPI003969CD9A